MSWWMVGMPGRDPFTVDADQGVVTAAGGGYDWLEGTREDETIAHLRRCGATVARGGDAFHPSTGAGRPGAPPPDKKAIPFTTAHLLQTIGYDLVHTRRHLELGQKATGDQQKFDLAHAGRHLLSAMDHHQRLAAHIREFYPREGAELAQMHEEAAGQWGGAADSDEETGES